MENYSADPSQLSSAKPLNDVLLSAQPLRAAIYARVSTDEQTRGNYPSCDSQIDELARHCRQQGYEVVASIKDEGFSAGSLKRPGLSRLRSLVSDGGIDVVRCTWYDRLSRARDFYQVDAEFKGGNIDFGTLHDTADRETAAGRFMESVVIAAKTYEREQTAEKVSLKMRMRSEKGMYSNGKPPYGFRKDPQTHLLWADEEKASIVARMFDTYIRTQSDFAVRDWLKSQGIPSPGGKSEWSVGSICDILKNRRYKAQIEINKKKKGVAGLSSEASYRIIEAQHPPIVPVEVWEMASSIRRNRAEAFPGQSLRHRQSIQKAQGTCIGSRNSNGSKIGYSRTTTRMKSGYVFQLQGLLHCAACGHPLSPNYVEKKPNEREKRRTHSFINYYECSYARKYSQSAGHQNRILASRAESWVADQIALLAKNPSIVDLAMTHADARKQVELAPTNTALCISRKELQTTEAQIEALTQSLVTGKAQGASLRLLLEKAETLEESRNKLRLEIRALEESMSLATTVFDGQSLKQALVWFNTETEGFDSTQRHQALRWLIKGIECGLDGKRKLLFPAFKRKSSQKKNQPSWETTDDWFDTIVRTGCAGHRNCEPLIFSLAINADGVSNPKAALVRRVV